MRMKLISGLCLGALLLVTAVCHSPGGGDSKGHGRSPDPQAVVKPTDNSACLSCHSYFERDEISEEHEGEGMLCTDCHGLSLAHMEEDPPTSPADVTFTRAEVDAFCNDCHNPRHHPERKTAEFIEQWEGYTRANGRTVTADSVCTDCHGRHTTYQDNRASLAQPAEGREWIELINGKDLQGWQAVGQAKWTVENGQLVGTQGENQAPGDLLSEASYRDFLLEVEYRVEWPANSGIWFRYQSPQQAYQADILEFENPECYSGSLYCPGKMFLNINGNKKLVDRIGFNKMVVRAQGQRLMIWINDILVADVEDDLSRIGKIGFQIHEGDQFSRMKIVVRKARLKVLD